LSFLIGKLAVPAEISSTMQGLFATLPLWPLLAAIGIGLLLATKQGLRYAHWLTVGGVGISATLAVLLYLNVAPLAAKHAHHGDHDPHAADSGVNAMLVADTQAESDGHVSETHADSGHAAETHSGADAHSEGGQGAAYSIDTYTIAHWFSLGQFTDGDGQLYTRWVDFNFAVDGLTITMLLFVCVVSLMVVTYAVGYMKDHHGHPEVGYQRFFAWLGLFVFSMVMLVMSGNFVLLYLGWEAVGLCSYLLIGFYYKKPEAAAAAKKAFIVNRIGDFGFALGIFTIYMVLKDHVQPGENVLDYATVFKYAGFIASQEIAGINAASLISLLLFCGAIGKSAQFPLYVWLPDAMEGPTPVSALIHAATMVTAGVYMTARCGPLFMAADPYVLDTVMWVGVIGAVLAATMAMAQYDMKRILAYSTISQLAFMFVALGCQAPMSAVFHVFTHAFFKALLFLTAGSVMHAMGGIIDVRHFSGLRKVLPTTHMQMLIGCLALAGVPLLAGFWSKDEIVHAAMLHNPVVGWIMVATAGLTAYYTFRMFFLCFYGEERWPQEAGEHPHEMPGIMTGPLWVLAIGAIFTGYLGVTIMSSPSESFLGFLNPHGYFHAVLSGSTIVSGTTPYRRYLGGLRLERRCPGRDRSGVPAVRRGSEGRSGCQAARAGVHAAAQQVLGGRDLRCGICSAAAKTG
jgi:proton-translocating NADH-quinone oxidoreductase chain L